jgi:hypothetical protein
MAKIISQYTFFDYSELEILGDLERLQLTLEGIDDEELMRRLEKRRGNGRNEYPVRVMWNLIIAMTVFGHKTVASFRRELERNSQLRKICGLNDYARKKHLAPPARVFTRFFSQLSENQAAVNKIFEACVGKLYAKTPEFGKTLAGDGKYLDSYAKRPAQEAGVITDGRTENDAAFSIKEYHYTGSDGKKHTKKETHYGFKAHIICDVKTELPIAYQVTAANYDEKKAMGELLQALPDWQKEAAAALLLDRGYDSTDLIRKIKGAGINPVVDIRNCWKDGETTKQYKNTNIVYNYKGDVYYVDEKCTYHKMNYEGYDRQKNCLRYSHKGKIYRIYISYDERVFLPLARDSKKFMRLYKGRTAVERLNGRLDRDFMFEDHCIRGLKKMQLRVSLAFIVMNGMALGKINRGITQRLAAVTRTGLPLAA